MNWLKALGSSERPLRRNWREDYPRLSVNVGYPSRRKPSVVAGDLSAAYAAADKRTDRGPCIFGVYVTLTDPYLTQPGDRDYDPPYAWRTEVRFLRSVDDLADAPSLFELDGVFRPSIGLSVRQQSHIELHETEWDVILRLFGDVGSADRSADPRRVLAQV
jgi:hypothetical protein